MPTERVFSCAYTYCLKTQPLPKYLIKRPGSSFCLYPTLVSYGEYESKASLRNSARGKVTPLTVNIVQL